MGDIVAGLALSLTSTARRHYQASPAWRLVHRRRFHAFCVGAGKSGTHSIAGMLEGAYRTAHEPETDPLIDVILAEREGRMSPAEIAGWLRQRDRRLWLEMDSSGLNGAVVGHLAALHPEARFVLTIRDCYSWLDSLLNHHATRPTTDSWRRLRDARFPPEERIYEPGEEVLRRHGLFPVGAYLKHWAAHNQAVLKAVPAERLLVIRTDRIADCAPRLAAFLGVPLDTLDVDRAHMFRRKANAGLISRVDPALIERRAAEHCGEIMASQFPDIPDMASAGLA